MLVVVTTSFSEAAKEGSPAFSGTILSLIRLLFLLSLSTAPPLVDLLVDLIAFLTGVFFPAAVAATVVVGVV